MGHSDTVKFLLHHRADPNPKSAGELDVNDRVGSALGIAARHGHEEEVQLLLARTESNAQDRAANGPWRRC